MPWDVATARIVLKEPADPPSDAAIQSALDYTMAYVERTLGRRLLRTQDTETFHHVTAPRLQLHRYPLERVDDIVADPGIDIADLTLRRDLGVVEYADLAYQQVVTITYAGGYDDQEPPGIDSIPWPADLERMLWEIFVAVWQRTDPETGTVPPDQTIPGVAGQVKSVTIFDSHKIDYDVESAADSGAGFGDSGSDEEFWGFLYPWAPLLRLYQHGPAGAAVGGFA